MAIAASRLNGSPASHPRGGVVVGEPRDVRAHLHVGDAERHRLVAADRRAERLAFLRVAHRLVDAGLREADGERADRDAALVEGGQELRVAAAALAEHVGRRHPAVLEDELAGVGGVPADLGVLLRGA